MNQMVPVPTTQDGWCWDGSQWVCNPCPPACAPCPPCPPVGPPIFSGPANQPPWYPGANGGVSFSATPPPNPVRGHFWWDGQTLSIFDGAAWVPVGGAGVSPKGVTNGQPAAVGQVGETVNFTTNVPYAAYPAVTTVTVFSGIVQPGDWDFWASLFVPTEFGGASFSLNPTPAGMSNGMQGEQLTAVMGTGVYAQIIGQNAFGNFATAQAFNFQVVINQGTTTGLPAGTAQLQLQGRRRR